MNANGECIELPNTMAIKVYDIVKALGFDTSFKRHKKLANTTYEKIIRHLTWTRKRKIMLKTD